MSERKPPSSLIFAGFLLLLALAAALIGGATIYVETHQTSRARAEAATHGHVAHGRIAISAYGCGSCHVIPGITGANGKVGPDLTHVAQRAAIAGALPNDPDVMARWLEHPQKLRPGSGMPEMNVTDGDARDMAAYLYSRE